MGNSDLTQIIKNILTEIELLKTQNKISNLTMPENGVIVVPSFATDPTTYSNGQMWYNTTSGLFKYVEGGTIKVFGGGSVSWGGITGTLASQTDLQSALDAKAASSHNHVEADITDLDKYTESEVDTLLSGKSDTGHTHTESDITDLGSYLEDITGESIDDLSDVNLGTPSDADVLQYDSATSKWIAQALSSLGGGNATQVFSQSAGSQSFSSGSWQTVSGVSGSLVTTGGDLLINLGVSAYKTGDAGGADYRIKITDGTNTYYSPNSTGARAYWNATSDHQAFNSGAVLAGVTAGSYTVTLEFYNLNNTLRTDSNDYLSCSILEV